MVFASALAAVAVTLGIVAVYCAAAAVLALGMLLLDVATVAAAVERPAVSVVSAVRSPLCAAAVELQVSAAAVVSVMVEELAGPLGSASTAALHQGGSLQRGSSQQAEEEEHEKEKRLQIGLVHYLKWNQYFQEKKAHLEEQW